MFEKGNYKKKFYSHFMLLVCGVKILINYDTFETHNNLAVTYFRKFISQYSELYGENVITYNVHSLLQLSMFVKIHGPLENFSCFKYENYFQELKKSIKCATYHLPEIHNRIIEKKNIFISNPLEEHNSVVLKEIGNRILNKHLNLTDKLFEKIILQNLNLTILIFWKTKINAYVFKTTLS